MMWISGRGTPPSFEAEGDRFCWPLLFRHSRHASTQKNVETPDPRIYAGEDASALRENSLDSIMRFSAGNARAVLYGLYRLRKTRFVSGHDFSGAVKGQQGSGL